MPHAALAPRTTALCGVAFHVSARRWRWRLAVAALAGRISILDTYDEHPQTSPPLQPGA